jgi:hypothetical protein
MAAEDIKRVIFDKYFLFLLVIIVVHLYDGLVLQFNRGGTAFLETFAIYLLLAVFGAFFVFGPDLGFMSQEWWKNLLVCMLVSGVAWGLPFLLYLIVGNFAMGSQAIVKITGIMLFSPAWLWFMYMHQKVQESPLAGRILMWYFAMWIIVICLSFINYASVIGPVNSYKAPVWQAALMVLTGYGRHCSCCSKR